MTPGAPSVDVDIDAIRRSVGRTVVQEDTVQPVPMRGMAVTFHRREPALAPGDPVPPGWHAALFLPSLQAWELNPDGTPLDNGVLPPMPLPRRMHAGVKVRLLEPLRLGDALRRENTFSSVELRQGRSGPLLLSTQTRRIFTPRGLAVEEEYVQAHLPAPTVGALEAGAVPAGDSTALGAPWQRTVTPGSIDLFRYSALTFNAHRIHYDRDFALRVEGLPGVVVHGMFTAQCLIDLARDRLGPDHRVTGFSFRALAPLFEGQPIRLFGQHHAGEQRVDLWAVSPAGIVATKASVSHD